MKKVILVLCLVPYLTAAQITDNFETGEINTWVQNEPARWKADTLNPVEGRFSLHHVFDNTEAGNDRIAYPVKDLHPGEGTVTWTFSLRHGYEPSSSNNWMVWLLSECDAGNMTVAACTGAWAIGVNIAGSDDSLRLVKIRHGTVTTVLNTGINWQADVGTAAAARVIISRGVAGEWEVKVYRFSGELIKSATGSDAELFSAAWFGISYRYSSTKDRLLWIDDVGMMGVFYADTVAPSLAGTVLSGRNTVDLTFTEAPAAGTIIPSLFTLDSGEAASSVKTIGQLNFRITFPSLFKNKKANSVSISNICDSTGNCSGKIITEFTPVWAERGDVIISEIMADPVPKVSLPEKEYIEITNRTDFGYDLKGWKLHSGEQSYNFPIKVIAAQERIVLCSRTDTSAFSKYGRTYGFSSFPSFPSEGNILFLTDSCGTMIHGVEYSSDWYGDDLKAEGGWSLEMIDEGFPFFSKGNWTASSSRTGGTPGRPNASAKVNEDSSFEGLMNVFPEDSIHLIVEFSESLPDTPQSLKIEGIEIFDISAADPLFRSFLVTVNSLTTGKPYHLAADRLYDFAGNAIMKKEFVFGLPEQVNRGEILFNEILFNPVSGKSDYIEFYNASEKTIDASRLFLVSIDDLTGDTSALAVISEKPRCIMPSSYYAITEDATSADSYPEADPGFIFRVDDLPSMADDEGHLLLLNRELDVIDEVRYSEKMHYPLLASKEGVSLEKTNPDLPSGEAQNWHSASESAGWGTPGTRNSVFSEIPASEEIVSLSSSRITPDSDGIEDLLSIGFRFPSEGYVVTTAVFDESGGLVRKLATNLLSAPESLLIWDGKASDGAPVSTGIYIILISWYNDTGQTGRVKKVCTVIR